MGMKLGSGLGMRLSYGMGTRPIIFLLSIPSCNQQLRKNEIVYTHSAAGSVVLWKEKITSSVYSHTHTLTCWCLLLTSLMGLTTSESSEHCWYSCSTSLMLHCTLYHTVNEFHCLYMRYTTCYLSLISLTTFSALLNQHREDNNLNRPSTNIMTVVSQARPLWDYLGSLTLLNFPDHLELHPAGSELHFSAAIPL